jgi:hypothetical protein
MNTSKIVTLTAVAAILVGITASASYAGTWAQNHPRRAQVLGRDTALNRTLWSDRGHLGGNFGNLMSQDRSIRQQAQADAKANGGYITRAQQHQLNQEENGLRNQMNQDYRNASAPGSFAYNHPRRAQVLSEDASLRNEIHSDAGNLNGHYGQLMAEDRGIARQEQRDARINGGYITTGQETRLQNEESRLQNQINNDL